MKRKNRKKYINTNHRLFELGYNPTDLVSFKTQSDYIQLRTLVNIKSKIVRIAAKNANLTFKRAKSNKPTKVCDGCWIGDNNDWSKYCEVVFPFYLSLIESGNVTDIIPSGNNQ